MILIITENEDKWGNSVNRLCIDFAFVGSVGEKKKKGHYGEWPFGSSSFLSLTIGKTSDSRLIKNPSDYTSNEAK